MCVDLVYDSLNTQPRMRCDMTVATRTTATDRARELFRRGGQYTPSELMEELDISRAMTSKITKALRATGEIEIVGTGYSGAEVWGATGVAPPARTTRTRAQPLEELRVPISIPARSDTYPSLFDPLVVTSLGVDTETGHAIGKLQRKDGTTWIVDFGEVAA